jgi:hypothetical protein
METIKTLLKKWFGKERRLNNELNNLRRNFQVTERGGQLWIVENGIAIHSIAADLTATEIVALLNRSRKAAVSFVTSNENSNETEAVQN